MMHYRPLHRDVIRAIYYAACEFVPMRANCPAAALERIEDCQKIEHRSVCDLAARLATIVLRERLFPIANLQAAWLLAYTVMAINGSAPRLEQATVVFLMRDLNGGAIGPSQFSKALRLGRTLRQESAA